MTEGIRRARGPQDLHARVAPGRPAAGRRGHLARLQLAQRPVRLGRRAAGRRRVRGLRAGSARPRQVGRRALLRREVRRLHGRRGDVHDDGEGARARAAGVPARPQRGRRGRVHLHARAPGGARGPHLRELRATGAGAGLRAGGAQGAEPRRAARARAAAQERGLLARSRGRRGDERRPADRARDRSRRRRWRRWSAPTSG